MSDLDSANTILLQIQRLLTDNGVTAMSGDGYILVATRDGCVHRFDYTETVQEEVK